MWAVGLNVIFSCYLYNWWWVTEFIKESVIEGIQQIQAVLLSVVYKSADVASCIFPWPGMDWLQAAMESR